MPFRWEISLGTAVLCRIPSPYVNLATASPATPHPIVPIHELRRRLPPRRLTLLFPPQPAPLSMAQAMPRTTIVPHRHPPQRVTIPSAKTRLRTIQGRLSNWARQVIYCPLVLPTLLSGTLTPLPAKQRPNLKIPFSHPSRAIETRYPRIPETPQVLGQTRMVLVAPKYPLTTHLAPFHPFPTRQHLVNGNELPNAQLGATLFPRIHDRL